MWTSFKRFLESRSWKTDFAGIAFALCFTSEYAGYIPEAWDKYVQLFCAACITFGFISGKDGDKSNAPVPTEKPQKAG